VLLARPVSDRPGCGQEFVGREVSQLNGSGAGALEVEVEAANVVCGGRERLTIAKRINRRVGYRLLLIWDSVWAGAVCAEEHVPSSRDEGNSAGERAGVIVIVGRAGKTPEDAATSVRVGWPLTQDEGAGGDDHQSVLRSWRDSRGAWQFEVLFAGAMGQGPDARNKVVSREVPQLNGYRAGVLESEVEPCDVVETGRE
jgi:hypothetical protein